MSRIIWSDILNNFRDYYSTYYFIMVDFSLARDFVYTNYQK
ncbi:hypothetical protein H1P_4320003 [Hyella patelloides LEGE 07179]|uniref:Uncharacterized protein n=1 Tax=Hyella patelloides LEGE 07179 TaxID=945734 RepID=A0A563VY06_9CYAN|nr:hypothetical protein H1P_4320003 [Hyella patelloides LEGE 07179]